MAKNGNANPLYGKKWQCFCGLFSKKSGKLFQSAPFFGDQPFFMVSITIRYHILPERLFNSQNNLFLIYRDVISLSNKNSSFP